MVVILSDRSHLSEQPQHTASKVELLLQTLDAMVAMQVCNDLSFVSSVERVSLQGGLSDDPERTQT
jgi:hypothetical protein